jgi:Big-like domain-containing protein
MPSSEGGTMSGTRIGLGRSFVLGICLALALLLLAAKEAQAGKYVVSECGWHVDSDAQWGDSTGGAKFRPDAYCVSPPRAGAFDGVHLKSLTREGAATVSGTRFARWRWVAPVNTTITRVTGTWWHTLHDGFQQRVGVGTWSAGFEPFATAAATDVGPSNFAAGFNPGVPAIEDRLLCARPESGWCSLDPGSWSSVRAMTFTLEENTVPAAAIGGDLLAGGWRRGGQGMNVRGDDSGVGVRLGETLLDGNRIALTEYPCAMAWIDGELRGTRMQPCLTSVSAGQAVDTTNFSDRPHTVVHCVVDFAGNRGCSPARQVLIDNNPPAHPRNVVLAGGDGWRRANDFDIGWSNPDQGQASPIGGVSWRIFGPGGYDTHDRFAGGRNLTALRDLRLPASGTYTAHLWLRDEAGNEAPGTDVSVPLRLDDLRPSVAFAAPEGEGVPATVGAEVADAHSGPAKGEVYIHRLGGGSWTELPTKLQAGTAPGKARLVATMPEHLDPGTYVFRADASDAAGNTASTTLRADGKEMAVRKAEPPPAERKPALPPEANEAGKGAKTRLFAHLRWRQRRGPQVTVPFSAAAALSGRLVDADGAGLAARRLRIVSRPSRGAFSRRQVAVVATGSHGGFRFALPSGPSRRITVSFAGDSGLAGSRRPALALRVQGAASLDAAPRVLHNGESVRLWGRVRTRGAALPRRGKLVAIQYYEASARRWRPVLVVRSDHGGRFLARYRFRYVTGTATIRLRAVALAEERWPYAPGTSQPVTVRVSG